MDEQTPAKSRRRDFLASSAIAGAVLVPGSYALNVPQRPSGVLGAMAALDAALWDLLSKNAGPTEWLKVAGMASACDVWMAPHHEPQLHGHLLAAIPNGYILETFGNPDRDPWWFELYTRKPEIVNSRLTLLDEPGIGVDFDPATLKKYGSLLAVGK